MSTGNSVNISVNNLNKKIPVRTGRNTRFRIRPLGVDCITHSISAAVFAFDSAFPGPGIFQNLKLIQEVYEENKRARLVIFGHTDEAGSTEYNKRLSDRRALAVMALLSKQLDIFDTVNETENWGDHCYQAMLRGIGCNPGAIDGAPGVLTEDAVRWFQHEYNLDVYHRNGNRRAYPDLAIDGNLGPLTRAALRDAYVSVSPGYVPVSHFADPPIGGCSEYNPISGEAKKNRRVVVAFFNTGKPHNNDIPCRKGAPAMCEIDDGGDMRCRFYRRFIHELSEDTNMPKFFDFQWLREDKGTTHLSALTSLPDGTTARFTIYRSEEELPMPPPNSSTESQRPTPGPELAAIGGRIVGGVCYARWKPPEDYDPFDYENWLVDHDIEIWDNDEEDSVSSNDGTKSTGDIANLEGLQPPVFCIDAGGHWGYSPPPGMKLSRLHFINDLNVKGIALLANGSFAEVSTSRGRFKEDFYEGNVLGIVARGKGFELEEGVDDRD